ncbi:hypothetical protein HOU02_gp265 [Caulobacter phage CcrBL9]|uniref:Uncharacterized protein n=1 Tax=Caulobacter phage CcrBL9 TaxID=2283270 RepID=A0A385ECT2_9CAUD|nr:hypothetical protein HOU02_gp265 [Caulobacter phage CcrBL9]AXQ69460.1 hypothetical protein CcrBL9_gp436 [Caulobacter phage CcrBL9]
MFQPAIWERVTNTRWVGRADEHYRHIPLARCFGGYMPGHVEAKDMSTSIGNRYRIMDRRTGELSPNRLPLHRVFGGYAPAVVRSGPKPWEK